MTIPLQGAAGDLFNRIGKLGLIVSEMDAYQAAQLTNMTDTTNGVVAQYDTESDIQAIMGSSYQGLLNGAASTGTTAQQIGQATVNRMVFRDNPNYGLTLTGGDVSLSIQEIIRQMKAASASVLAMTIAATPTTFTGEGNGIIVTSTKRPVDGLVLENAFAETMVLTCTQDSYSGSALAGNEQITLTGAGIQPNPFAFDWPLGSNCRITLQAINGNADTSEGNLLTNSGFTDWTAGVPDNFTLVVGDTGDIADNTSIVYDDTGHSLQLIGDGSTLTQLTQEFDSSSGTTVALQSTTQYAVNLYVRRDGTAAASGTLVIDLIDEDQNVIQDENGVNNTFSINLTALTTSFQSYTGVFRTPEALPDTIKLRMRLTAALTNGRSVYLDMMSMGVMSQTYTAGPFVSVHAGSLPFVLGDRATIAVTNSRGSGGTLDTFQTLWARLFYIQMINQGLLLPSSGAPTISDGLIG